MEDPSKHLPLTHSNPNLFKNQSIMVDNIDNYKDRISEIFQLDEESFEYYNLMKKAIYLSE
jgi:hypothetical protein